MELGYSIGGYTQGGFLGARLWLRSLLTSSRVLVKIEVYKIFVVVLH